jgi:glutamate N-acetyltransferase/amino-acid N-acetyltransferase
MSVTAADGFVASGVACGIKEGGALDLALVATEHDPAAAAAVFTSNRATAAPVDASRRHLESTGGRARAVVLNSGNANAATGERGRADADEMAHLVAGALPAPATASQVLVCSTGLIGIPLPMDAVRRGIPPLVAARSRHGGQAAAEAILTTDTHAKQAEVNGPGGFTVGGMAKGAAMLAPDMATMLAVLTSDADVAPAALRAALTAAVDRSFNAISVDGCTSTNDTVILLASGRRGPVAADAFAVAVDEVCEELAGQMVGDAEGATKVVRVEVIGAASDAEARAAARKVAESQLVKCSLYGQDPYWGRVVSELGSAGVGFELDRVSVAYGGIVVCRRGQPAAHDGDAVRAHLARRHVDIGADLGLGRGRGALLTNDLTHAYVDENMRTS